MQTTNSDFIDIMEKNHMEIPWHDYANDDSNVLIAEAGLIEKASVIGRVGLIMLSCGTGAWRVRTSMNRLCFPVVEYCQYRSEYLQALPHGTVCRSFFGRRSTYDR